MRKPVINNRQQTADIRQQTKCVAVRDSVYTLCRRILHLQAFISFVAVTRIRPAISTQLATSDDQNSKEYTRSWAAITASASNKGTLKARREDEKRWQCIGWYEVHSLEARRQMKDATHRSAAFIMPHAMPDFMLVVGYNDTTSTMPLSVILLTAAIGCSISCLVIDRKFKAMPRQPPGSHPDWQSFFLFHFFTFFGSFSW